MSEMISVSKALSLLAENAPPQSIEILPLDECLGRKLTETLKAKVSRPPADMSAMDGYAVKLNDVRVKNAELLVIGEAPAGAPFEGKMAQGEAVRIFTGSVMPSGADHVVIQENVIRHDDIIHIQHAYSTFQFIRKAGMDFSAGDAILKKGTTIGPMELSLTAAANHANVPVYKRLKVGLLTNGNELKAPGSPLSEGEIINSNSVTLAALIKKWAGDVIDLGIAKDTKNAIKELVSQGCDVDIFVTIGGASVGDHDLMKPSFRELGFSPVFEKIAVKPGKPTWFYKNETQSVLGLPGNPASAIVCAHLFLQALLKHDFTLPTVSTQLENNIPTNGPRESFLRANYQLNSKGILSVTAVSSQDSSLIKPLTGPTALIHRRPNAEAANIGDIVDSLLLNTPER